MNRRIEKLEEEIKNLEYCLNEKFIKTVPDKQVRDELRIIKKKLEIQIEQKREKLNNLRKELED